MRTRFRPAALVALLLAGISLVAQAQPRSGTGAMTDSDTSTTVFRGTAGVGGNGAELPGYGSSTAPGYTTSAGGTTVFHGTPARMTGPRLAPPPPPWLPPASALGGER
jgi:hypothetical protein